MHGHCPANSKSYLPALTQTADWETLHPVDFACWTCVAAAGVNLVEQDVEDMSSLEQVRVVSLGLNMHLLRRSRTGASESRGFVA
jgi:hypothetical protein